MDDKLLFKGKDLILLNEYFEDKERLTNLKLEGRFKDTTKEIEECENKMKEFICSLDRVQLKQIIYMSLDFKDITDTQIIKYRK